MARVEGHPLVVHMRATPWSAAYLSLRPRHSLPPGSECPPQVSHSLSQRVALSKPFALSAPWHSPPASAVLAQHSSTDVSCPVVLLDDASVVFSPQVTGADVPMPYALNLERAALPTKDDIVSAVLRTTYRSK